MRITVAQASIANGSIPWNISPFLLWEFQPTFPRPRDRYIPIHCVTLIVVCWLSIVFLLFNFFFFYYGHLLRLYPGKITSFEFFLMIFVVRFFFHRMFLIKSTLSYPSFFHFRCSSVIFSRRNFEMPHSTMWWGRICFICSPDCCLSVCLSRSPSSVVLASWKCPLLFHTSFNSNYWPFSFCFFSGCIWRYGCIRVRRIPLLYFLVVCFFVVEEGGENKVLSSLHRWLHRIVKYWSWMLSFCYQFLFLLAYSFFVLLLIFRSIESFIPFLASNANPSLSYVFFSRGLSISSLSLSLFFPLLIHKVYSFFMWINSENVLYTSPSYFPPSSM